MGLLRSSSSIILSQKPNHNEEPGAEERGGMAWDEQGSIDQQLEALMDEEPAMPPVKHEPPSDEVVAQALARHAELARGGAIDLTSPPRAKRSKSS